MIADILDIDIDFFSLKYTNYKIINGVVIRRNVNSLEAMKRAVWAVFFFFSQTVNK